MNYWLTSQAGVLGLRSRLAINRVTTAEAAGCAGKDKDICSCVMVRKIFLDAFATESLQQH